MLRAIDGLTGETLGVMSKMISEECLEQNKQIYLKAFENRSQNMRDLALMFLYADLASAIAKFEKLKTDALQQKKSPSVGDLVSTFREQVTDVISPFIAYDAAAGLMLMRDLTGEWDVLCECGDVDVEDMSAAISIMFNSVFTELDTASMRSARGLLNTITTVAASETPALQFSDSLLTAAGIDDPASPRNDRPPMYISSQSVKKFVKTRKFTKRVKEVDDLIDSVSTHDNGVANRILDRLALSLVFDTSLRRKYPTILFFHGHGGTGKSTLIDLVRRAFGCQELSTAIKLAKFKDFELGKLPRKLFAYDSEASNGFIDAEASDNLKSVATLDTISVNAKYRQPYDLRSTALIVAAGNKIPRSADKSDGWLRRLEIVEVNEPLKRDDAWFAKIESDDAAKYMLEILLGRALDILDRGEIAPMPAALDSAKQEYILANDSVALWLADEALDPAQDFMYCRPRDVYARYEEWCDTTKETRCAPTEFKSRMCQIGKLDVKPVLITERNNPQLLMDLKLDPDRAKRGQTVRVFAPKKKRTDRESE